MICEAVTTRITEKGMISIQDICLDNPGRCPEDIAENKNTPIPEQDQCRTGGRTAIPQLSIHWTPVSGRPSAKLCPNCTITTCTATIATAATGNQ